MENNKPKYFYRYMNDGENFKKMLINHQLCMSHPTDFNDPYDCYSYVKGMNNTESREMLKRFMEKRGQVSNRKALRSIDIEKDVAHYLRKALAGSFILCFTERCTNPIMWAHYANNHHGVCVEFNMEKYPMFYDRIHQVIYKDKMSPSPFNVWKYDEEDGEDELVQIVNQIVCTKYKGWSYEEEWRVRLFREEDMERNKKLLLEFDNTKLINKIYFGMNFGKDEGGGNKCENKILEYRKICRENGLKHVEFYKMGKSIDGSFEMQPHKCEIQPYK